MTHDTRDDQTLGALVHQLTTQVPDLIRSEIRLAQAEMTEEGKAAGTGLGMFSAAGLLAFFGLAALITTAILGLSHVVDPWLASLMVGLALLAIAAIAGLLGRKKVASAGPPKPELAMDGLREDLATVRGNHHHD